LAWETIQPKNIACKWTYNAKDSLIGNNVMRDIREVRAVKIHLVPYELHSLDGFTIFNDPGIFVCCEECNICRNEDTTPRVIAKTSTGQVGIVPPGATTALTFIGHRNYVVITFALDSDNTLKITRTMRVSMNEV
jgi:hypothetical protein